MFVNHRFSLKWDFSSSLLKEKPRFGYDGFGEFIFYRTYSRLLPNGKQESWAQVCIRVIEGVISIRKDWYLRNFISWNEGYWQSYAQKMCKALFDMKWFPGGRGLWVMGTNFIYESGSMALFNCAYIDLTDELPLRLRWLMDALMNGVGVGFGVYGGTPIYTYSATKTYIHEIEDSREGWTYSVERLVQSYTVKNAVRPIFDYSKIRPKGQPIKRFGGIASGPEYLRDLHSKIDSTFDRYRVGLIGYTTLLTDLANLVGCCVIAGNVRRSAEIAVGKIDDPEFLDLKNYTKHPERSAYGWMSNNSVILEENSDFEYMQEIAKRVVVNGEPGYLNKINFQYGRIDKCDGLKPDLACGINPCGEIPLENYELCNLAETCPTNCDNTQEWLQACEYATVYCSTVSLLPTHSPETNDVIARNRRIGVGIIDVSGWKVTVGVNQVTKFMRQGYKHIGDTNRLLNQQAGVPESIRKTTMKPGGTVPKLVGRTSGIGHPNFHYMVRRVRIAENSPLVDILKRANVPYEKDAVSANTLVFEYPILQGPAKEASKVSAWEQAANIVHAQREWSDNSVSNTVMVREHEFGDVEAILSWAAPHTKSLSLLPVVKEGAYAQMPEESISKEEYEKRKRNIGDIDWSQEKAPVTVEVDKYCDGDVCVIKT